MIILPTWIHLTNNQNQRLFVNDFTSVFIGRLRQVPYALP